MYLHQIIKFLLHSNLHTFLEIIRCQMIRSESGNDEYQSSSKTPNSSCLEMHRI